jgi:hypothetical protein
MSSLKTILFTFITTIFTIKIDSKIHYLILGNQCLEQCSQRNLTLRTIGTIKMDSNIHYLILGNQCLEQCSQCNLTLQTICTINIDSNVHYLILIVHIVRNVRLRCEHCSKHWLPRIR